MALKKIVLAEDDRDLARALALRCQDLGFEVRTAHDPLTALNLIVSDPPDLVCLDYNMPGGSGLATCEMVTTNTQLRGIQKIILTGSSDEAVVRRCHELCAYYVLKSPDVWQRLEPLILELFGELSDHEPVAIDPAITPAIGDASRPIPS